MSNDNVVAKPELYYQPESEFHHQLQNELFPTLADPCLRAFFLALVNGSERSVSKPDAMRRRIFHFYNWLNGRNG
jgi:hypothetical protein